MREGAIASRAADFLVIGLDTAGDVPVDDEAEIGAVHAHTEGVGGDHDGDLAFHEAILGDDAFIVCHAGMVDHVLHLEFAQHLSDALDLFAGAAIDDAGGELRNNFVDAVQFKAVGAAGFDDEAEVVALESADEDFGCGATGGAEAKLLDDVIANFRGGGGGQGHDAGPG